MCGSQPLQEPRAIRRPGPRSAPAGCWGPAGSTPRAGTPGAASASYALAPGSRTSEQVPVPVPVPSRAVAAAASKSRSALPCGIEAVVGRAVLRLWSRRPVWSVRGRAVRERGFDPRRTQPGQQRIAEAVRRDPEQNPTDAPSRPSATAVLYGPPPEPRQQRRQGRAVPLRDQVDQGFSGDDDHGPERSPSPRGGDRGPLSRAAGSPPVEIVGSVSSTHPAQTH